MITERASVPSADFARATGWLIKPAGACKGAVCVPLLDTVLLADDHVDVRALAAQLGMGVAEHDRWIAVGPESATTGRALTTALVPDLELPDVNGAPFRLSSLRGQKVVVVAWASWCGCREDLRLWQALRDELHPRGLEVVTVALDTGGAEAARPWLEKAAPEHPALIDTAHALDAAFGVVNVPNAVWIDETGTLVRPAEPAWLEDPHASSEAAARDAAELPPDHRAVRTHIERMHIDQAVYPAMIRDWVRHGSRSRYALEPWEVVERSQPRSLDTSTAAAHFELGELLHRSGDHDAAVEHWRAAHRLHPDNWTYKRQAWNLEQPDSVRPIDAYGTGWLQEVEALGAENYYPAIRP